MNTCDGASLDNDAVIRFSEPDCQGTPYISWPSSAFLGAFHVITNHGIAYGPVDPNAPDSLVAIKSELQSVVQIPRRTLLTNGTISYYAIRGDWLRLPTRRSASHRPAGPARDARGSWRCPRRHPSRRRSACRSAPPGSAVRGRDDAPVEDVPAPPPGHAPAVGARSAGQGPVRWTRRPVRRPRARRRCRASGARAGAAHRSPCCGRSATARARSDVAGRTCRVVETP